ncbi:zinc metallopeptidase [Emticicia sp. BO119]|uniref:zinc metallopeptidase n=1 Tax=Emticicia sp. BO119 TaxID=2757768 RepID=UPI0015F01C80|nr:zinc metallopeptidase [Emticicia sp. BO119]MBA4851137.1 zinc metallopeptidase [Emticicia sp. BO119]
MIFVISIVFMLLGLAVSSRLKRKFAEYSQVGLSNGMTGAEIARKMLNDNGIYDVRITQVEGQLTDHYDPISKTVNLSYDVYNGNSAASAAVAAHECGHAVQHAVAYAPLKMRSALVPIVNVATNAMNFFYMFGFMFMAYIFSKNTPMAQTVLLALIVANAIIAAFSLITLPVEYDASNRALAWMENRGVVNSREHGMAKDALKWAALTYVVAAAGAVANLLYYLSMFLGRRD